MEREMERNKITPEQELWLKALESGEYRQCKGFLKSGNAFCCLGLARELIPQIKPLAQMLDYDDAAQYLHLRSGSGRIADEIKVGKRIVRELTGMNDEGMTFAQIAAFIRANPHQVFTNFDRPAQP